MCACCFRGFECFECFCTREGRRKVGETCVVFCFLLGPWMLYQSGAGVNGAGVNVSLLVAGLCWTTATCAWGLAHYKDTCAAVASPLAGEGMAVAIPVDDGGIYSQQPLQPPPQMRPAQPPPLVAGHRPQPQPQRAQAPDMSRGGGGGGGGGGAPLSAKEAWEQRRAARAAAGVQSGFVAR